MEKLRIREYKPDDKAILLDILKLNVPQYFAVSEINDFELYLDNEIEKYYVAELAGQIVGAGGINFDKKEKTGKISWDFIHPDFQGIKVGRKLLKHRIDILKSMSEIEHITVRTSQLAFKFYEKNGFVLIEVKKNYWAEGFDMCGMIYKEG